MSKQVVWRPLKFGEHKLSKPSGELRGYLTLTPVRLGWMSALDDYTEIVWGTEYRVCQSSEVDTPGVPAIPAETLADIRVGLYAGHTYASSEAEDGSKHAAEIVARIDAALTWLNSIAERGEG